MTTANTTPATESNLPAIPDKNGAFTVQTPDGPQELQLIRTLKISDIPPPPPLSPQKQRRRKLLELRDKLYQKLLSGTTGQLKNGITWRLNPPKPGTEKNYFSKYSLCLSFDDPRTGGQGVASGGFRFANCDFERDYLNALEELARKLELRQLVPADPGDPDGFFVKWAG
jgi:hypothetical protein